MKKMRSSAANVLVVCLLAATAATSTSSSEDEPVVSYSSSSSSSESGESPTTTSRRTRPSSYGTCSLYLAPTSDVITSSSNDDADDYLQASSRVLEQSYSAPISMGVYAGRDLPAHTRLGHTDLVIPIVEVWSHIMHRYAGGDGATSGSSSVSSVGNQAELATRDALDVISQGHHGIDYHMAELLWEPRHFGGAISGTGYDSKALAPGLGSLVRGGGGAEEDERHGPNVRHGQVRHERAGVRRGDPSAGVGHSFPLIFCFFSPCSFIYLSCLSPCFILS